MSQLSFSLLPPLSPSALCNFRQAGFVNGEPLEGLLCSEEELQGGLTAAGCLLYQQGEQQISAEDAFFIYHVSLQTSYPRKKRNTSSYQNLFKLNKS